MSESRPSWATEAAELYAGGESFRKIGARLGVAALSVRKAIDGLCAFRTRGRPRGVVDPQRLVDVARMHASGMTNAEIGAAIGLTRQRAGQIVKRAQQEQA